MNFIQKNFRIDHLPFSRKKVEKVSVLFEKRYNLCLEEFENRGEKPTILSYISDTELGFTMVVNLDTESEFALNPIVYLREIF